jgi:rubrerythrin
LHEELQSKGKLPDECELRMAKTTIREVLEGLLKKDLNMKKMTNDDLAMIRNAVRLEEKVIVFYERLVDRADNPHDKTLFGFCVSAEKAHLQSLKDAEILLNK